MALIKFSYCGIIYHCLMRNIYISRPIRYGSSTPVYYSWFPNKSILISWLAETVNKRR